MLIHIRSATARTGGKRARTSTTSVFCRDNRAPGPWHYDVAHGPLSRSMHVKVGWCGVCISDRERLIRAIACASPSVSASDPPRRASSHPDPLHGRTPQRRVQWRLPAKADGLRSVIDNPSEGRVLARFRRSHMLLGAAPAQHSSRGVASRQRNLHLFEASREICEPTATESCSSLEFSRLPQPPAGPAWARSRMMTATTIRACSLRQMCPVVALQTHARGEIVCSSPVFTPACCHRVEAGKAASAGCGAWLPVIS